MPAITLHFSSDNGCAFERVIQPARFCAPDWAKAGCHIRVDSEVPDDCEWFGFHGLPSAAGFHAFNAVKHRGQKLLWSMDDDMERIPAWNPALAAHADNLMYLPIMKRQADLIVCSTPALADTFADVAEKVMVAPNLTDLSRFPPAESLDLIDARLRTAVWVDLPVRVMWSGSNTHAGDIEFLGRVIPRVFEQVTPKEVEVSFIGMAPPGNLIRDYLHRGVKFFKTLEFHEYRKQVNKFRPNVWLAPLADLPFNYSKSNLRVLEGWSLSAAVIASPVGEYGVIRSGIDGRLADTEDAWVSAIVRLVRDHAYRLELACEGRLRAESEYDWNRRSCRVAWDNLWSRVFGAPVPVPE